MAQKPFIRLLAGFYLLLAALQLLFLMPQVLGGRALDFVLFRVDALSLSFGVAWTLALALMPNVEFRIPNSPFRILTLFLLFTAGLLGMAYAREPLVLLVGWEIAGLAIWLSMRGSGWGGNLYRCALSIHLPGLLLLAAIVLGSVGPFAPPVGGAATPWSLFVAVSFGVVALWRAGCWLFWGRGLPGGSVRHMVYIYVLVAPFLLAKALVAAPWDAFGVWSLALIGTIGLLGSLVAVLLGADAVIAALAACAAVGVAGLGLAPASPLAAAGAVALTLTAPFWVGAPAWVHRGALLLAAALLGIWLLAEGALDAHYKLVAAILLPAISFLAYRSGRVSSSVSRISGTWYQILATGLLIAVAIYPQAAVEWVIRPAVGAMAGGVAFPSELVTNWGLGLTVQSAQEQIVASLPATGIALAVFLAWVALYWLRALARRMAQ